MLLTTLMAEHPQAVVTIVRRTPVWVGALFLGLVALGATSLRTRAIRPQRLVMAPIAVAALALWGVQGGFAASGRLGALLLTWALCFALVCALGLLLPPAATARYDAATGRYKLAPSAAPLIMMLGIFALKYAIGVQLALEPALAGSAPFGYCVAALYGVLAGQLAARTLRVLRVARPGRVGRMQC